MIQMIELTKENQPLIDQCAQMLIDGFTVMAPDAWPTLASALAQVDECLHAGYSCRVAVDEKGNALGWIGGRQLIVAVCGSCTRW